jgi:hypothetical protein
MPVPNFGLNNCHGNWEYPSIYGWRWVSRETKGEIVDHSARSVFDPDYGWLRVPGSLGAELDGVARHRRLCRLAGDAAGLCGFLMTRSVLLCDGPPPAARSLSQVAQSHPLRV